MVQGQADSVPKNRPVIFVANHQSLFDIPLTIWYLRNRRPHFIAKKELGRGLPALSHALRHMGSALIDRGNAQQALSAISSFGHQLEAAKGAALIFPEGTRSRDGTMRKFKPAGLRALLQAMPTALVVPLAIDGSWRLTQYGMRPVPFGKIVTLRLLPPVEQHVLPESEMIAQIESSIRAELTQGV